jgi:hypothetical protein
MYYKKQEFAWFTISPISTKRTTTSHLKPLNTTTTKRIYISPRE